MGSKTPAVYSWLVSVVGGAVLVFVIFVRPEQLRHLAEPMFLMFFVLEGILTAASIPVGKFHVSLDFSIVLATYMIHGLVPAAFVNLAVIPTLIYRRLPVRIVTMDVATLVAATLSGGVLGSLLDGFEATLPGLGLTPAFVREVCAFTAGNYLVNTAIMAAYAYLSARIPDEQKKREVVEISALNAVCTLLGALLGVIMVLNFPYWNEVELSLFSVALVGLVLLTAVLGRSAKTHTDLVHLYEAALGINSATRLDDVFDKACHASSQLDRWDFWWLILHEPTVGSRIFKSRSAPGIPEQDALNWVMSVPDAVRKAEGDTVAFWSRERCSFLPAQLFGSAIFMPLRRGHRLIGELGMARVSTEEVDKDVLRMYAILSTHVSLAVDNAVQWENLTDMASRDPLTGLYNYREFCSRLAWALDRAAANSSRVSLIFIDLDHFRRVNNLYGHVIGDEALKQIAASIKATVRDSDFPCRYGGDEFTIILPNTGKDGARKVAERIVRNIAETSVCVKGQPFDLSGIVSASWGVATFPEDGRTVEELVNKADVDMYSAKRELQEER